MVYVHLIAKFNEQLSCIDLEMLTIILLEPKVIIARPTSSYHLDIPKKNDNEQCQKWKVDYFI